MSSPYVTQILIPGTKGLDIHTELDLVSSDHLTRMSNIARNEIGALTTRPGLTTLGTVGSASQIIHSIMRLNNPRPGAMNEYVIGAGTSVFTMPTTGAAATQVDTGYSGNPILMIPYHPQLSSDPWMVIADSARMSKVRQSDGLRTQLGLPSGTNQDVSFHIDEFRIVTAPVPSLGAIDLMEYMSIGFTIVSTGPGVPGIFTVYGTKNTNPITTNVAWNNNAGSGVTPSNSLDTVNVVSGALSSVKFTTKKSASGAYYNFWTLNTGTQNWGSFSGAPATDDDIIHLWLRTDNPAHVSEVRLYFIVSTFDASTLPGTDGTATKNTDSYVYSFRPSDFETAVETPTNAILTSSSTANTNLQTTQQLQTSGDTRASTIRVRQLLELSRAATTTLVQGISTWSEFGNIGVPLHRRDFRRVGNSSPLNDWTEISGLCVVISTLDNTDAINVWLDGLYLTGGAGQDSSLVGLQPYNYVYTNYDPRTGAEGNPSPPQNPGYALDSLRQAIVIDPPAFGDPAIRQRFYRMGGSINNNFFFVGQNTSDGAAFTDTASDATAAAATPVALDNNQPVSSLDTSGNTVNAQPINSIFGPDPTSNVFYGVGDPNRAGTLYWTKPGNVDSWPPGNTVEICPPSEQLIHGVVFGGATYVFSRECMYMLLPNIQGPNTVTPLPTGNQHGLVCPWALDVGISGIAHLDRDGIYLTTGGDGQNITDSQLREIFHGATRNGYLPVDYTHPEAFRIQMTDNEIFFQYQDTGGTRRVLIYSMLYGYWRFYQYPTQEPGTIYSDTMAPNVGLIVLQGGRSTGKLYTWGGATDDGSAIASSFRTGALDQGQPRENKLWGDMVLDAAPASQTITITPLYDNETVTGTPQTITGGVSRTRFYAAAAPNWQQNRNITFDVAWSSSATPAPIFYRIGPSYITQADTHQQRATDWDNQGRLSDKLVKGMLLECIAPNGKTIQVFADGVLQQTINVPATGATKTSLEFSWPEFLARELSYVPTDSNAWQDYNHRWIFDEEPVSLTQWETQPLDLGMPGWKAPILAHVTLNSTTAVTMTVITYDQLGGSVSNAYTIPSTGGLKIPNFVPFVASKGVLFKFQFASAGGTPAAFRLYREESSVMVQGWDAKQSTWVKPFGTDDLDLVRTVHDAGLVAMRDAYGFSSVSTGPNPSTGGGR